jgi:hypothetical protein
MSKYLYRVSRFYVGRKPSRRLLWVRYKTAPAVVGGYAFLGFFVMTVGFAGLVEVCRFFHVGIRQMLLHAAAFLQNLNH